MPLRHHEIVQFHVQVHVPQCGHVRVIGDDLTRTNNWNAVINEVLRVERRKFFFQKLLSNFFGNFYIEESTDVVARETHRVVYLVVTALTGYCPRERPILGVHRNCHCYVGAATEMHA